MPRDGFSEREECGVTGALYAQRPQSRGNSLLRGTNLSSGYKVWHNAYQWQVKERRG